MELRTTNSRVDAHDMRLAGLDALSATMIHTMQELQRSIVRLTESNEKMVESQDKMAEETGKWIEVLRDAGGAVRTIKRVGKTKMGLTGLCALVVASSWTAVKSLWTAIVGYIQ